MMHRAPTRLLPTLWLSLHLLACGGTIQEGTTPTAAPQVNAQNLEQRTATLHAMDPADGARIPLRDAILTHLAEAAAPTLAGDDFDAVVEVFATMVDVLLPQDYEGPLPEAILPVAARVVTLGSPRGDEARVMAALRALRGSAQENEDEYRTIGQWGAEARASIDNPFERLTDLIVIWEEHARLSPSGEILRRLADLHIERRDAVESQPVSDMRAMLMMRSRLSQLVRIAPFDVAGVFLAHGDLENAAAYVRRMGENGATEAQLLRAFAAADGGADPGALLEIAEAYREVRPRVSRGICRLGLRRHRADARFSLCLARIASQLEDIAEATSWYGDAIAKDPSNQTAYDEALARIDSFLEDGINRRSVEEARSLAQEAERIFQARETRFPGARSAVPPERIPLLLGMAELRAGNLDEARQRFAHSIELGPSVAAYEQLGFLHERQGEGAEATAAYRAALQNAPEPVRPLLMEKLAHAIALSGDETQARSIRQEALASWDRLLRTAGDDRAFATRAQLRRAALLLDLDRATEAGATYRQAALASPRAPWVYVDALSKLATSAPNLPLAEDMFRRAQRQASLTPEWRVYLALWVRVVAARAGQPPSADILATLSRHSGPANWSGMLARFGAGQISAEELIQGASTPGEETEAHFYAGAFIAQENSSESQAQLQQVLSLHMVNYYEYAMAQAILHAPE